MSVYNPNDPRDVAELYKLIGKARECKYKLEVHKFHPIQTDNQQRYIHFMLSYWAMKNGDTFYSTLNELQEHICPVPFYTGERDERGNHKFKPLTALTTAEASSVIRNFIDYAAMNGTIIPEPDDKISISYCKRELEQSGAGWV